MSQSAPPAPPQLSPDGKWWWNGEAWVPASRPAVAPAVLGGCQVCGSTPAAEVNFRQHIGMILFWQNRRRGGRLCRDCAIAVFRRQMDLTLMTGWWGLLSGTILNPYTIVYNLVNRFRVSRWPHTLTTQPGFKALDKGRPVFLRPGLLVALALTGIIVWGAMHPTQPTPVQATVKQTDMDFTPTIGANGDVAVTGWVKNVSSTTLTSLAVTCTAWDAGGASHNATDSSPGDVSPSAQSVFSVIIAMAGHEVDRSKLIHCAAEYDEP
ncbi:MAG TPA: hypothetical protein VF137_11760 [Candidatus Dormibacteraeota bacterium]